MVASGIFDVMVKLPPLDLQCGVPAALLSAQGDVRSLSNFVNVINYKDLWGSNRRMDAASVP